MTTSERIEKIQLWRQLSVAERRRRLAEFSDPLYLFLIEDSRPWGNTQQSKEEREMIINRLLDSEITEELRVFLMNIQDNDTEGRIVIAPTGAIKFKSSG